MIRVAYIVYCFDVGGIERCVAHLANHLDRARFQPEIIALTKSGGAAEWIAQDDVPILEVHKRAGNDPQALFRLARVLRDREIDLVHSHNWGTLVETTLARRWAGVPVHVHSERGTVLGDLDLAGSRRWVRSAAMRWSLGRADAVVSNAFATAGKVERMSGYPAERMIVIPNGVTCPSVSDRDGARAAIHRDLQIGSDAIVIGSVGRLVAVKNFGMAIDAVAELHRRDVDLHLLLVGAGPEQSALSRHAAASGIARRVHLVGHQDDFGRWMAAMDLYVNCSNSEGMSQSIGEAVAMGLPLIVTDVGDNARFLDSESPCGEVVPAGDVPMLCQAISRFSGCRRRMVEFGRAAAEQHRLKYSLDAMIRSYAELYENLQQGGGRPDRSLRVTRPSSAVVRARAADDAIELLACGSAS
ncbi:MAG: glycosyltransferase [Planctomycetaceae bacterium]